MSFERESYLLGLEDAIEECKAEMALLELEGKDTSAVNRVIRLIQDKIEMTKGN